MLEDLNLQKDHCQNLSVMYSHFISNAQREREKHAEGGPHVIHV